MLGGIRISCKDKVWCGILSDLGAVIVAPDDFSSDLRFVPPSGFPKTIPELKALIMSEIHSARKAAVARVLGKDKNLTSAQEKIISVLDNVGADGISPTQLCGALGYSANTHAMDTMIYNLRKAHGKDFIKFSGGKYKL